MLGLTLYIALAGAPRIPDPPAPTPPPAVPLSQQKRSVWYKLSVYEWYFDKDGNVKYDFNGKTVVTVREEGERPPRYFLEFVPRKSRGPSGPTDDEEKELQEKYKTYLKKIELEK